MPNETTGAPFNLEQNTPGVGMNSLSVWNGNNARINEGAMHKSIYDPTNINGNAFLSSNHKMTGYSRASEFTPVVSGDSPLSAISKLEAGVIASGDMQKAVYDTNGDGIVDHAEVADEANSVAWASVVGRPVTLPNPNALTIQLGGVTAATYTGNAAATVNATPASIGAASLVGGKVPAAQLPISSATDSDSETEVSTSLAVSNSKAEAIAQIAPAIIIHNAETDAHEDIRATVAGKFGPSVAGATNWDSGNLMVESGTWTPTIFTGDVSISSQNCTYEKLGSFIRLYINITLVPTSSTSTQIRFGGMPLAAKYGTMAQPTFLVSCPLSSNIGNPVLRVYASNIPLWYTINSGTFIGVASQHLPTSGSILNGVVDYNTY